MNLSVCWALRPWLSWGSSRLGSQHSSGASKEQILLADVLHQHLNQRFSMFVIFLLFLFKQTVWWQNDVVFKVARGRALRAALLRFRCV